MPVSAVRRAFSDILNHKSLHMLSVSIIALSVFIVSAFFFFYTNATAFLDTWRNGVRIIVYLKKNVDASQRASLIKTVEGLKGVSGVEFISKDAAYNDLKQKIGKQSSLLDGLAQNPLPDALEIIPAKSCCEIVAIEKLTRQMKNLPQVDAVEYAQEWLYRFNGMYQLFKLTGLVLGGVFILSTLLIVANTMRLIMHTRREEIEIIRIIGADEGFIKYPLFLESIIQGVLGGITGILMLYLAFILMVPNFSTERLFAFFEIQFISVRFSLGIVLCTMLIGWMGCFFSIRKFLKL